MILHNKCQDEDKDCSVTLFVVGFRDGLVFWWFAWQRLLCTKVALSFLHSAGAGGGEGPSEPKLRRGGEKLHLQCTRGEVLKP